MEIHTLKITVTLNFLKDRFLLYWFTLNSICTLLLSPNFWLFQVLLIAHVFLQNPNQDAKFVNPNILKCPAEYGDGGCDVSDYDAGGFDDVDESKLNYIYNMPTIVAYF